MLPLPLLTLPLSPRPRPAQVHGLAGNREALLDALSPLGLDNVVGGEGAIYLFAKLPDGAPGGGLGPAGALGSVWSRRRRLPDTGHACRGTVPGPPAGVLARARGADRHACPNAGCDDDDAVVQWLVKKHKVRGAHVNGFDGAAS